MAHSLESRVPFLDREVFAMSATVATPQKVSEAQTKIALRNASKRAIPNDWAEKPKLGFPVPIVKWLREDDAYNTIKDAFTGEIAAKFFDTALLVDLLERHKAGADLSRKIWIIYMFLMWYKIYFVDQTKPE
jgi:asparagine synthase (glutamine-hydrolysing)